VSAKQRRKAAERKRDNAPSRSRRDDSWDERLRLVGDACFTEVEWSKRDRPSWPLPAKEDDAH